MQSSVPKASHLYKINQLNDSKNIVKDLLEYNNNHANQCNPNNSNYKGGK